MARWVKVQVNDDITDDVIKARIDGTKVWEPTYTPMLDHGYVGLVDFMGSDDAIAEAARVSYAKGNKRVRTERGLIRYLMRHAHWTPFEMCEVKFHVKAPILVFRQWHRHRTACLAGDVRLDFQGPKGGRLHSGMTVQKFHDLWHKKATQKGKGKEKPSFCERLEEGKFYSVPELSKLVERSEEDIRTLIHRGKIEAVRIPSPDRRKPSIFIDKTAWSKWADHRAMVPNGMDRDRLRRMNLRYYNEETDTINTTHVVDIWSNGVKKVFHVRTDSGTIRMTEDHLCFTDRGWLKLSEAIAQNAKLGRIRAMSPTKLAEEQAIEYVRNEEWLPVVGAERYKVSNYGRVRSISGTLEREMKLSDRNGYLCVSLQYPEGQMTRLVHHLVLEAFDRSRNPDEECRHLNGNPADNRHSNLVWGTTQENADDRVRHGSVTKNRIVFESIVSAVPVGEEEVFDLEVETPFHNFVANGFVVHNSINEMSARYSVLDNEMYMPAHAQAAPQSGTNKQGRADGLLTENDYIAVGAAMEEAYDQAYSTYQYLLGFEMQLVDGTEHEVRFNPPDAINNRKLFVETSAMNSILAERKKRAEKGEEWTPTEEEIEARKRQFYTANGLAVTSPEYPGLTRELARAVLPVATYSQMYWKTNLRNLLGFLKLRQDAHAQYEIRVYAQAMYEQVKDLYPLAIEAYDDYVLNAKTFSKQDLRLLALLLQEGWALHPKGNEARFENIRLLARVEYGMSVREIDDLIGWIKKEVPRAALTVEEIARMKADGVA